MRSVAPLALLLVLAACAPATTVSRFNHAEGGRVFTLSVDGQEVQASSGTFSYRTRDFDLVVRLSQVGFDFDLANTSASTLRLTVGRSTIVLADGSSSPVVTSVTSPSEDPQPTVDIPLGARAMGDLLPSALLRPQSGGGRQSFEPMFEWPLSSPVTIRLLLSVEIDGRERVISLVFEGTPPQQVAPEG